MPASSLCVFRPLGRGEDHPIKRGAGSGQRRRQDNSWGMEAKSGVLAEGPLKEQGLGGSPRPGLGSGAGGSKGVTHKGGSDAGETPGACAGCQAGGSG